jgi:hypothetical protein
MTHLKCLLTSVVFLGIAGPAAAQSTSDNSQPPAGGPVWSAGEVSFSGLVDGYYDLNFNHPESMTNQLRNFDVKANQFSLNMAKLTMEHAAEPAGFRVDLGFGKAFDMVNGADTSAVRNIEQAYVSLKPAKAKGLQLDFGKFVTSAGAEVIETPNNWNYSRSILFAWAIPYYHFGLRASAPMGKYFTGGFQLVNGWNNVEDNNSGKTIGLAGALAAGPVSWSNNYYAGPEKAGTNQGWRHLYDTTLLVTGSKTSAYFNFDYGVDRNPGGAPGNAWYGVAGAARYALTRHFAIAPRLEWFNDRDGFSTGTAQTLKEFTLTGEYKWVEGLLSRIEYRRDWSDQFFFDRGASPAASKSQSTLLAGFVAYFGPKR